MISISHLSFQYQDSSHLALDDVNLTVREGDFVGIIGASGAGKTTLTYAINGVVPHYFGGRFFGEVKVGGLDTVDHRPEDLAVFLGSVFQDVDAQMVAGVVEDEILFGLENFGVAQEKIAERLSEALAEVGITELRERNIAGLSGGQKQKVAICAAVALKPKALVLDEPTGELDPQSSRRIFQLLKELNEKHGMTIVIVEQKIMLLAEFARRLVVMDQGRILFDDAVREVLRHSRELKEVGVNCPTVISLYDHLCAAGLYDGPAPANLDEAEAMARGILND